MRPASNTLSLTAAGLLAACAGTAYAAVYTGSPTGNWSVSSSWTSGDIANTAGELAQINPGGVNVDQNFTIGRLQNSGGSASGTITGPATLTIDVTTAADAIVNLGSVASGGRTLTIDTNIVISNSNATAFSAIRNNNSTNNVLAFGSNSVLTLDTPAEVPGASVGIVQFNGELAGTKNLRIAHNNVSFGATSDSPSYTGEFVLNGGANVVANTTAGNTFYGGPKFQVNGNSTLTINNADVIKNNANVVTGGTNTLDLNVNANQNFGNLILGSGTLNLTLGAGVTDLNFLPSAAFAWTGTFNINNFTPGVVGFGFDGGLSAAQLGLITIDGSAPTDALFLTDTGKLALVPEPGTFLLALGGAGLLAFRRRGFAAQ